MDGDKQTTQATTKNTIDPYWDQAAKSNYAQAQQTAANFKPVHMEAPAGFTQDQLTAQQMIRDLAATEGKGSAGTQALMDSIQNYKPATYNARTLDADKMKELIGKLEGGVSSYGGVASYGGGGGATAAQIGDIADITAEDIDRAAIRDVTTQMTPEALQSYLAAFDPSYDQAVMAQATSDLERGREIAQQQNASAANMAGAFGGSRHGLVEAETNRNFADTLARTSADLRLKGLDRALGAFQSDEARALQAAGMNQNVDWQAAQANVANALEAARANQATALSRGATNAQLTTQTNVANAQMAAQAAAQQAAAENARQAALFQAREARALAAVELGFGGLKYDTDALNYGDQFNITEGDKKNAADISALPYFLQSDKDVFARNTAGIGLLSDSGASQQALDQAGKDVTFFNNTADQQAELTKLGILQGAVSASPMNTETNSSGTTEYQQSLFNTITGLGGKAASIASMFSDERLKKNIRPISSPLARVRKMKGVSYNWRGNDQPDLGLVAQDVQRAMPGAVSQEQGYLKYSMPAVLGLLTSAVKELDRRTRA